MSTTVGTDLHHKMSKKIAQLTKVIYHLNTKNEDNQAAFELLKSYHQSELNQILQDTTVKMSKMKEILEKKQLAQQNDYLSKIETIKQDYQKGVTKFDSQITEYKSKYDSISKEFEQQKVKFQEKIKQFTKATEDMKKSIENNRKSEALGIDELKRQHEQDIDAINERWKSEVQKKTQEVVLEMTERMKVEIEKEVGQCRAVKEGEKQEALMGLKRDFENKLQQQKDDYSLKIQKLQNDEKDLIQRYNNLEEELQQHELLIKKLQNDAEKNLSGRDTYIDALKQEVSKAQLSSQDLQQQLNSTLLEVSQSNKLYSDLSNEKNQLLVELQKAKQEIQRIEDLLSKISNDSNSLEGELRKRLEISEHEANSLRNEINSMALNLSSLRNELKTNDLKLKARIQENEQVIQVYEEEKISLKKKIQDLEDSFIVGQEKAASDLALLLNQMKLREDEFLLKMKDQEESYKKAIELLQSQKQGDYSALQLELQDKEKEYHNLIQQYKDEINQWKEETKKVKDDSIQEIIHLNQQFQLDMKLKSEDFNKQNQKLQDLLEESDKYLKDEQSRYMMTMKALEDKYNSLLQEIHVKNDSISNLDQVVSTMKKTIQSLQDESMNMKKAHQLEVETSKKTIILEYTIKLQEQDKYYKSLIDTTTIKLSNESLDKITHLNDEINILRNTLCLEAQKYQYDLQLIENEKNSYQLINENQMKSMNDIIKEHEEYVIVKEKEYRQQIKELKAIHQKELKNKNHQYQEVLVQQQQQYKDEYLKELEIKIQSLRKDHVNEIQHMQDQFNKDYQNQQRHLQDEYMKQSNELKSQLGQEKIEALGNQEQIFTSKLNDLSNSMNLQQETINKANETIIQLSNQIGEMNIDRDNLIINHEEELELTLKNFNQSTQLQIQNLIDKYNQEVMNNQRQHDVEVGGFLNKIKSLQEEIQQLNYQWSNRSSLPDDVIRISKLEQEIQEQRRINKKMKEDMEFYKLELKNREENYNNKFNAKPVVGVMNVLKSSSSTTGNLSNTMNSTSMKATKSFTSNSNPQSARR